MLTIDTAASESQSLMVVLLGGASGVGKTSVSYRLARHLGMGISEIDDFQIVLEHMTTPEQQPTLHFWRTKPDVFRKMSDDERLAHMIRYAEVIAKPLELVIANHIETHTPILLEGDFLLPSLVVRSHYNGIPANGQVRGAFIYEQDEDQIAANYQSREGEPQRERARTSWRYSEWLRAEADRLRIPTIAARPWDSTLDRVIAALHQRA